MEEMMKIDGLCVENIESIKNIRYAEETSKIDTS
jgi:hypothetical protein